MKNLIRLLFLLLTAAACRADQVPNYTLAPSVDDTDLFYVRKATGLLDYRETALQQKGYFQNGVVLTSSLGMGIGTLLTNAPDASGGVLTFAGVGSVTEAWNAKLDAFGALAAPDTSGLVLSSTTGGTLSWVPRYANATASGTNVYTATPSPALTSYTAGLTVLVTFTNGNTGGASLNLNSLGAVPIEQNGVALILGQIPAGSVVELLYDGTNFQIVGTTSGAYTFSTGLTNAANTVTVNYGTTAGTAAQGNDARITGAFQTSAFGAGVAAAAEVATNVANGLVGLDAFGHQTAGLPTNPVYFGTFSSTADSGLIMGASSDGFSWKTYVSSYAPPGGTYANMGNPSVIKIGTKWWLTYRNSTYTGTSTTIGIAASTDLVTWTFVQTITVNAGGSTFAWAPEWFYDSANSLYRIYLAQGTGANKQIYETHPTSSSAPVDGSTTWSTATAITGTSLPSNVIDPVMIYRTDIVGHGPYFLWYKNESNTNIEIFESASPTTGFIAYKSGNWMGIGATAEAPSPVLRPDGTWILYFSDYNTIVPTEYYTIGSSDWSTWSSILRVSTNQGLDHGTVILSSAPSDVVNYLSATSGSNNYQGCSLFGATTPADTASSNFYALPSVCIGPVAGGAFPSIKFGNFFVGNPGVIYSPNGFLIVRNPSSGTTGQWLNLDTSDNVNVVNGNLIINLAGKTISIKGGSNAASGSVTLSSGTATISSTAITVKSVLTFTMTASSGTPGTGQPQSLVSAGSAAVTGLATDNSTYTWTSTLANQ